MRLIFAGSGEFGIPALEAIRSAGLELALVISQPDRPAGRGRHLTPTPISTLALAHGLPLLRTPDINTESLPPADLMVVIAFGQKIGEPQVRHPRLGSINLHGSRLPRHRGAAPINAAILAGDSITGNSVIRVAPRMDAGAILGMSEITIDEYENAGDLHDRLAKDGAPLLLGVIRQLQDGTAVEIPQDEASATKAPKLSRQTAKIDWNHPSQIVARRINGLAPWPGCHVRLVDSAGAEHGRLLLVRAMPHPDSGPPGVILPSGAVGTGSGAVVPFDVQPEGRRVMELPAYRLGHPWQPGMRLESL